MTSPEGRPRADVLLSDGSIASISRLRAEDGPELVTLHDAVSDESSRMRFFTLSRPVGHAYAEHLLAEHPGQAIAFVARLHGELVALASAEVDGSSAEVAFLVADHVHGLGIGTLLLEHLAAAAREVGIRTFTADVLTENHAMVRVFTDAGFAVTKRTSGTVTTWEISTTPTSAVLEAADERERLSEVRSLRPLLAPRSVAVLGVRRDGKGIGNAVLQSIVRGGFTGTTHVVHPDADRLLGVAAHRSLREIPGHVDLAVLAVPADRALDAMLDAAAAGVSAVVMISSGFGEIGPAGTDLQQRILQVARDHDIRLVGPNCLGLLCNDDGIRLNATFSPAVPPPGGLAIASQSGGVGIALLDLAQDLGVGVQSFVSLGNQADVCGTDLLAAWHEDPKVTAAALYVESLGNPRTFARVARRFSERKPLLAVVGGRSAGGARAGASHTAAVATSDVGVRALFAQTGVINCHGADELAHASRLLTEQPLPGGRRLAIVSNAGGIGILAADSADELGFVVPELSEGLQASIHAHLDGTIGVGNPIDLGAAARADSAASVVELLLASREVDVLLVAVVATSVSDPTALVAAVTAARSARPAVPVLVVALGGVDLTGTDTSGVTVFRSTEDALAALNHAVGYADWLSTPREATTEVDEDRAAAAREVARECLRTAEVADLWLGPLEQVHLLGPYGVVPVGDLAHSRTDAGAVAARIGFPVAVKVADPKILHKTDRGLVRIGLTSRSQVRQAVQAFAAELHTDDIPVLVQPIAGGVELALGLVRHATFGPLIMVAAGGVATEVWNDRTFLIPPVTSQDALRALHSLRIWPLLQGFRGSAPADLSAVVQLVVALGQVADDVPEITELDLNPVVASAAGAAVVDAKVRLRSTTGPAGPAPRQLSAPGGTPVGASVGAVSNRGPSTPGAGTIGT